jgi:hypothetical protein
MPLDVTHAGGATNAVMRFASRQCHQFFCSRLGGANNPGGTIETSGSNPDTTCREACSIVSRRLVSADEAKSKSAEPTLADPPPRPAEFPTDYSQLSTVYANFARVNVTPEELALDFGLNTQITPDPSNVIKLTHRVVMNFYTAKRLMNALLGVISQYENTYGVLELDFQRRARTPGAPQPPAPPPPAKAKSGK